MKSSILIIFSLICINDLIGQNNLSLYVESGISTIYISMPKGIGQFFPEPTYLGGRVYWDKNINFPVTVGLQYESSTFKINNNNYNLILEGNASYRYYNENIDLIILSTNLYFPKKIAMNKFNTYCGLRYAYILTNFGEEDFLLSLYRDIIGGVILTEYSLKNSFKIGINGYFDISKLATRDTLGVVKNRTFELMFRLSYNVM